MKSTLLLPRLIGLRREAEILNIPEREYFYLRALAESYLFPSGNILFGKL